MAFNGSGTFNRTNGTNSGSDTWEQDRDEPVAILASRHDLHDQDIADGLTNCITKDGQTTPTADLPMGGFQHTGCGAPTDEDEYLRVSDFRDGTVWYGTTGGSSTAYTLTLSPAPDAYVDGLTIMVQFHTACTSNSATLNVNGLGANEFRDCSGSGGPWSSLFNTDSTWIMRYDNTNAKWIVANYCAAAVFGSVVSTNNLTQTWGGQSGTIKEFDAPSSSNTFTDFVNSGSGTAGLKVNGTTVTVPFTGLHRYLVGNGAQPGDAVYLKDNKVYTCTKAKDAACAGVLTDQIAYAANNGNSHQDSFEDWTDQDMHHIASHGDTRCDGLKGIKVVGAPNSTIPAGSFGHTSDFPGFFEKQNDDIMHAYTRIRFVQDVQLDDNGEAHDVYAYFVG